MSTALAERRAVEPRAKFPSPFDETGPHPLAAAAVEELQSELRSGLLAGVCDFHAPDNGKMFGVLVVRKSGTGTDFVLRAFSGTIAGRFDVPGFVPPIFDRSERDAFEIDGEKRVKQLNLRAAEYAASDEVARARDELAAVAARHEAESAALRGEHSARRRARRELRGRLEADDTVSRHALDEESRRDKREQRALAASHADERRNLDASVRRVERRLAAHERLCAMVSRNLMRRIHDTYRIVNARGETQPLRALYVGEPPSGAGDCAAPKFLAYACANGLTPVALAEFWWGAPPAGGGRVSGSHYPACREKCRPLLDFMLDGLEVEEPKRYVRPAAEALAIRVLHEDESIVVVDKPCGLLSVPSRDEPLANDSVLARLRARYGPALLLVHRLDMDTSGVLLAARDPGSYRALQRQFSSRTVTKRYVALVEGKPRQSRGVIDLAIRVDVADRPRQIHDPVHGRRAITEWRVLAHEEGRTRLAMFPRTGRTHQLRVHAAHPLGLALPIVGDRLYGHAGERLMLHAESLEFEHPRTGARVKFESVTPF